MEAPGKQFYEKSIIVLLQLWQTYLQQKVFFKTAKIPVGSYESGQICYDPTVFW